MQKDTPPRPACKAHAGYFLTSLLCKLNGEQGLKTSSSAAAAAQKAQARSVWRKNGAMWHDQITAVRNLLARWPASTIDVTPCEVFCRASQRDPSTITFLRLVRPRAKPASVRVGEAFSRFSVDGRANFCACALFFASFFRLLGLIDLAGAMEIETK